MDIDVEPLSSHPEAVPMVAGWQFSEWGHTDPGGSLEGWTAAMARQAGADKVPGTLIALSGRTRADQLATDLGSRRVASADRDAITKDLESWAEHDWIAVIDIGPEREHLAGPLPMFPGSGQPGNRASAYVPHGGSSRGGVLRRRYTRPAAG